MEKTLNLNVYISRNKSVKDLKDKLAELYNRNIANLDITSESIKLWKLKLDSNIEDIKKEFSERSKPLSEFDKRVDFGDLFRYIECNT